MSRRVRLTLLCEDTQHEAFARRFLREMGWSTRQIRVEKSARGHGSAEQFVRRRFPSELHELRKRHGNVSLAVLVDGDRQGVARRIDELDTACDQVKVQRRRTGDSVFVFVPTWSIETWLAYLEGNTVSEIRSDYPRLGREKECRPHAEQLVDMCRARQIREPAPSSLIAACVEYQHFVDQAPAN